MRNILLSLIARSIDWDILEEEENEEGINIPVTWKRKVYHAGLMVDRVQTIKGKKGHLKKPKNVETMNAISGHQEVIDIMFGPGNYTKDDLLTTEDVIAAIMSSKFLYKSKRKDIVATFKGDIERNGLELAEEFKKFL